MPRQQHLFPSKIKAKDLAVYCPLAADLISAAAMSRSMERLAFPMYRLEWQCCPEQM